MSENTKEPMFQHEFDQLAVFENGRTPVLLTREQYQRAKACVNACKGIDTKFLEEALLAGEEPALYAHTLMQQRDELLAALKPIAVSGEISAKIIADARAAITKVEAGQ